jgi:hypothetical protein
MVIYRVKEIDGIRFKILNIVLLLPPLALSMFYPQIGSVLGYMGSCCALLMMYILPISVHLTRIKLSILQPDILQAVDDKRIICIPEYLKSNGTQQSLSPTFKNSTKASSREYANIGLLQNSTENSLLNNTGVTPMSLEKMPIIKHYEFGKDGETPSLAPYYRSAAIHSLFLIYGVSIIVFQFVKF